MNRFLRRPPSIPSSCRDCPARHDSVCQPLHDDALEIVESFKWGERILPAGSKLYQPGGCCLELFTILDGWIALYRDLKSGRRQILDFALPGSFLGYQPDLFGPMVHGAACISDVSVCVFPRRQFVTLIKDNPELAIRLASLNSRQAVCAQDHLTNIGCRTAKARIVHLLLELCARMRRRQRIPGDQIIEMPLTQRHIGNALGLTNVYVSQTLHELKEQNLLVFKRGRLLILDSVGLSDVSDHDEIFAA